MSSKKTSQKTRHSRTVHAAKKQIVRQRPVHKKILLHPLSTIALLVVGAVMVFSELGVNAASYIVTATVPAPPLTEPAIIKSPLNNQSITNQVVTVTGSCPNNSYVEIAVNTVQAAVVMCNNNVFTSDINLNNGPNELSAQDYNLTNLAGPSSSPITVFYNPPVQPAQPPAKPKLITTVPTVHTQVRTTTPSSNKNNAFNLGIANYRYQVYVLNQPVKFELAINGGQPPYGVTVVWGDGALSTLVIIKKEAFTISHSYNLPAKNSHYLINVDAIDSQGLQTKAQIEIVLAPNQQPPALANTNPPNFINRILTDIRSWQTIIWPFYITVSVAAASYWIGEQVELHKLKSRKPVRRTAKA